MAAMDFLYYPSGGFCGLQRGFDVLLRMPSASGHWTMLETTNDITFSSPFARALGLTLTVLHQAAERRNGDLGGRAGGRA